MNINVAADDDRGIEQHERLEHRGQFVEEQARRTNGAGSVDSK